MGSRGHHTLKGALGQLAVTNFATARTADAAHFADGPAREIVVQHEPPELFAGQLVEALFVAARAERRGHDRLGFTAREQGGAVRARQDADFDRDGADFVQGAAVHARLGLDDLLAHDALLDGVKRSGNVALAGVEQLFAVLLRERRVHFFLQRVEGSERSCFLTEIEQGFLQRAGRRGLPRPRRLRFVELRARS